MKDKNNIDDFFRSGLNSVNSEPSPGTWDLLSETLDKRHASMRRKKRNRGALLLLLLLISFGVYKYSDNAGLFSGKKSESVNGKINTSGNPDQSHKNEKAGNSVVTNNNSGEHANENDNSDNRTNAVAEKQSEVAATNLNKTESSSRTNIITPVSTAKVAEDVKEQSKNISVTASLNPKIKTHSISDKTESDNMPSVVLKKEIIADSKYASSKNRDEAKRIVKSKSKPSDNTVSASVNSNNSSTKSNDQVEAEPENNNAASVKTTPSDKLSPALNDDSKDISKTNISNTKTSDEVAINQSSIKNSDENNSIANPDLKNINKSITVTENTSSLTEQPKSSLLKQIDSVRTSPPAIETEAVKEKKNSLSVLKKIGSRLSLDAFYSPDIAKRYLKNDESYVGTSAETQKNYYDNEKPSYSYSAGLRINYSLGSRWSISVGGTYSTFSQSASLANIYVQSDSVYIDEHNGHEPNHGQGHDGDNDGDHGHGGHGGGHGPGNDPDHNDSLHFIVQTSCGTIDLNNSFTDMDYDDGDTINIKTRTTQLIRYINVPVVFRYELYQRKLSFYVNAGASINFAIMDKVSVAIENYGTQSGRIDGLKNSNVSLILDLGASYNFYKKTNIFIEPDFRYSITPINRDNAVKSYPYFMGLRMGLGFKF